MAQEPDSPVKDKNYNLVAVLKDSLQHAWQLDTYVQDAEREGDTELADWLRRIQENNKKAGDQGKRMLAQRLQQEGG